MRLTARAMEIGLVRPERGAQFSEKLKQMESARRFVRENRIDSISLAAWFKRPDSEFGKLPAELREPYSDEIWQTLETDLKYEGYIRRQEEQIARASRQESRSIPLGINYLSLNGLRREAAQKLDAIRPLTLGQASRISGVTPADLTLLAILLEKTPVTES